MKHILSLAEITASDHEVVGGKALALARSAQAGLPVPSAVCITTDAYREYGLPCVTGIADAAHLITTGDFLTVDGFLGIVTIERESSARSIGNPPPH
jgi:phosphohistidine swiveling domain-containing protein